MVSINSIIYVLLLCLVYSVVSAQSTDAETYPEIGKPCPDFTLEEIHHFSKKQASLKDFTGKWLILDFWTRWCSVCVKSFPHLNQLHKEFGDKVQFMSIGKDEDLIREIFEKFKKRYDLQFPVAYDSVLFQRFGVTSTPHVIWINERGIVQAITGGQELTANNIRSFLEGENPKLYEKPNRRKEAELWKSYDFNKPFLVDGNGGSDTSFLFRSILTKWNRSLPVAFDNYYNSSIYSNEIRVTGVPLGNLYMIAFSDTIPITPYPYNNFPVNNYGKFWHRPLLYMQDTTAFNYDYVDAQNLYCYSLTVPPARSKNKLLTQQMMRRDLQNYFGYNVAVTTKMMPCWRLVATNEAKNRLQTKGGKPNIEGDGYNSQTLINLPMKYLIFVLHGQNQSEPPIVDETEITSNIDITIEADLSDLNEVGKALQHYGLDLVKGHKEMKVVVIRSPDEEKIKLNRKL